MIKEDDGGGFELSCDNCGASEGLFEESIDAIEYKNCRRWRSTIGRSGRWYDLCPRCTTLDIFLWCEGK